MKMKKKLSALLIGAVCAMNAADNQPLPADYSWIEQLRTDHPRIFINADLLPKIRKWAEKIGYRQVIMDAENFRIDPELVVRKRGMVGERKQKLTRPVTVARTYENEAMNCALAYLLTGEKKYAEKTWVFLDHNLAVYRDCAEKRTLINWYGMLRNFNMAALDWVWNASDPARCRKYVKDFVDVNIRYARHGWFGPFYGVNGGSGKASGFSAQDPFSKRNGNKTGGLQKQDFFTADSALRTDQNTERGNRRIFVSNSKRSESG